MSMSGLEGMGIPDENNDGKSEFENSEDERSWSRIGALRKRAIRASSKLSHSLKNRRKRRIDCRFPSVSIEDLRDLEEESIVRDLRRELLHRDLLPSRHDDYHSLLKFLKARDFNVMETIQMWEEMLNWREEFGTDTITKGKAADSSIYYGCSDKLLPIGKAIGHDLRVLNPEYSSTTCSEIRDFDSEGAPVSEGASLICRVCNIQGVFVKRKIQQLARLLNSFIVRIMTVLRALPFELWPRRSSISPTNLLDDNMQNEISSPEIDRTEVNFLLCLQRVQKMEELCQELNSYPTSIPLEKERMLQESLDRIRSVECDLEKTKRVLHATIVKQGEISQAIENLQQYRLHRRRFFCS